MCYREEHGYESVDNVITTTRQTTEGSVKEVTNSSVHEGGSKRF